MGRRAALRHERNPCTTVFLRIPLLDAESEESFPSAEIGNVIWIHRMFRIFPFALGRRPGGDSYRVPTRGTMSFGFVPGAMVTVSTLSTPRGSFTKRNRCSPTGSFKEEIGVTPRYRSPS